MNDTWTIFTDGGSRGNPGPAAYAYVIKRPGVADIEGKAYLGKTTNNIAEYTGLVKALEHAKALGAKKLIINSDSELLVKQLNGQYKVKNEGLRPLYQKACELRRAFELVTIKHVYRDQNSQADALCNEAMDDQAPAAESIVIKMEAAPLLEPTQAPNGATTAMRALDLLKQSAAYWAKGNANNPPPADVLDQLVEILNNDSCRADK